MKNLLISLESHAFGNKPISDDEINNDGGLWEIFSHKLSEIGYNLKTVHQNDLKDCAMILFIDSNSLGEKLEYPITNIVSFLKSLLKKEKPAKRNVYKECIDAGMKDKMVLLMWEGKSVKPYNYAKSIHNKFSTIITWDNDLVDNKKYFKFYLPAALSEILPEARPFNSKKLLVNISHNKYSDYKNELYSARREAIAYFDSHYPNDFDLYGLRWNQPITRLDLIFPRLVKKYGTYRGFAKDKIGTLSQYKFNICYENISDGNGYVSDKIFDSLAARVVPIYWGSPSAKKYVDPDAFIDRKKFKNDTDLAKFITQMTEVEYNKYLSAGDRYMKSEKYAKWLPAGFCERVIEVLKLKQLI